VLIRARDTTKPVLFYLAGGPGQSDLRLHPGLHEGLLALPQYLVVGFLGGPGRARA